MGADHVFISNRYEVVGRNDHCLYCEYGDDWSVMKIMM